MANAAAAAAAIALPPAESRARQETRTVFAIPSQTMTFTAHYVAHDAGLFQRQGLKVTGRYLLGVASPTKLLVPKPALESHDGLEFVR